MPEASKTELVADKSASESRGVALQEPPILTDRTQALIAQIEAKLGGPMISYWNSNGGSICANDVVGLYGMLRKVGKVDRISLFIKSAGGSGEVSLRMVNLMRQFTDSIDALVPLECASAATMLALGADRIMMGPLAHLSAVDTSLTHSLSPIDRDNNRVRVSQDELHRVIHLWNDQAADENDPAAANPANPYAALFNHVHPLVVGAVDRASALSTRICAEILSYHVTDADKAQAISNTLNAGYPSHSYPITLREARRVGLNAEVLDESINSLLLELNEVYSEMAQRAVTDFDERNSHDNSILNIIEGRGQQTFFQNDKDWHYRVEERRWVTLNDKSSWRKAAFADGQWRVSILHIH